ncbi:ABC transporter ATP-binding protein, partial [Actinomadura rugatobispora]
EALAGVHRHLAGFGVRALTSNPPTLEELFMRHYGDRTGAAEPAKAAR